MESYLRYTTVVRHFVQCNNCICYFVHRTATSPRGGSYIEEIRCQTFKGLVRSSKDGFDASVRSLGEVSKGFQAIAATIVDYSKKNFEDSTRTLPRHQRSASCMSIWRAMPTSPLSKPLLRRLGRSRK